MPQELIVSILIDKSSRVVTQGITGATGRYHTRACVDYGYGEQAFVAGVTPGKGGTLYQKHARRRDVMCP
jgi:succinyl-CoA synthetase alpha subunit